MYLDMQTAEDREFAVFIREDRPARLGLAVRERELVRCSTYEEARCVRRENVRTNRQVVIRFVGEAGGGD